VGRHIVEPADTVEGLAQDQQRPSVTDDVDGALHRAIERVTFQPPHASKGKG